MKILVRGPNWLGDAIFAHSFYRGLRSHYADSELTLLSHPRALGTGEGEWFDRTVVLEPGLSLSRSEFDLGITLPASLSSAFLLWKARIPHRVGFAELAAQPFLTTSLPWKGRASGLHKSQVYLELLELLTGKKWQPSIPAPSRRPRQRTIVIGPGASLPLREWPYVVALCEAIPKQFPGYSIKLVGAATDSKWKTIFKRSYEPNLWEDKIGDTSLSDLKEICQTASLVIANDSGLAHVAATLCGAPTLVLFGPGDPAYVLPLGERVAAVRAEIPCSPCESATCRAPFGYQRCLREVSVNQVLSQMAQILSL